MKLLGSKNKHVQQDKDGEVVPKLESVEIVLMHFNSINKNYQQAFKVLFTFVPNKQFGQLISISPDPLTMLNTTNTDILSIEVWVTDQNSKSLEIKDNFNMTLKIG